MKRLVITLLVLSAAIGLADDYFPIGIWNVINSNEWINDQDFKDNETDLLGELGVNLIINMEYPQSFWYEEVTEEITDLKLCVHENRFDSYGRWYANGMGMLNHYPWYETQDSLAWWRCLSGLYADSLTSKFKNDNTNFFAYRVADWDYGANHNPEGIEILCDSIKACDDDHMTMIWGGPGYYDANKFFAATPHLDFFNTNSFVWKGKDQKGETYYDSTSIGNQDTLEAWAGRLRDVFGLYNNLASDRLYLVNLQVNRAYIPDGWSGTQWIDFRQPTREEMRVMSYIVLCCGSKGLMYYCYHGGSSWYNNTFSQYISQSWENRRNPSSYIEWGLLDWDGTTRSKRYDNGGYPFDDLKQVISEIKSASNMTSKLLQLIWIDAFSYQELPRGIVKSRDASGGKAYYVHFGEFIGSDGDKYLMVVNRHCASSGDSKDVKLKLYTGGGYYNIKNVATGSSVKSGEADDYGFIDNIVVDDIPPGGGVLLHIDPDPNQGKVSSLDLSYNKATYSVNGRKIAIDEYGRIHVAYTDELDNNLVVWYAYSDDNGSTWRKHKLENNTCMPAIAVGNDGIPYVAYRTIGSDYQQQKTRVWSEGKYETLFNMPEGQVAICVDPDRDVGMVFNESGVFLCGTKFRLSTCQSDPDISGPGIDAFPDGPSCCFSTHGDAVCIDRCDRIWHPSNYNKLNQRNNLRPAVFEEDKIEYFRYEGFYEAPILSRHGDELWATFIEGLNIKRKVATYNPLGRYPYGKYYFDNPSTLLPNCPNTNYLQMANDFPFLVMERDTVGVQKVYYSRMNKDGTWLTPKRVTNFGLNIYERYPHVAVDPASNKAHIIWTQWGDGNISIGQGTEQASEDTVHVFYPNGGEEFVVNDEVWAYWFQDNFCEYGTYPDSTQVYVTYLYCGVGTSWKKIWSGTYEDWLEEIFPSFQEHYDAWIPETWMWTAVPFEAEQPTDCARIKVTAFYDGTPATDISDENFKIRGSYIYPIAWTEITLVDEPLFIMGGGFKTLHWKAYSFSGLDTTNLQATVNKGGSFSFVGDSCSYDSTLLDTVISGSDTLYGYEYIGTTYWTAPSTPTSYGYLRLMAVDTTSDTVYSYDFYPFCIPPPGGFQYNTYSNQNIMSLNDDGDKIGLVYTAQDPDTADKLSVIYMESDEGLGFSAPDTVSLGCWPAFSHGACFWQNVTDTAVYHPDTLFYAYQLNDTFATPYPFMAISPYADSGGFAPVGVISENDTVHAIIRTKIATHIGEDEYKIPYYSLVTLYAKFPEASPGMASTMDTLQQETSTSAAGYNIVGYAPSVVKRDSVIYGAYNDVFDCCFVTITPSGKTTTTIGQGSQPSVSCSEGNITYTYLGSGDTSLIRLWRYLDDTTWVERDTFYLDDDAEVFCGEEGLMYGVQREDTFLADLYVYDPISEEYYLTQEYTGYYPHTYLDDEASEFAWISAFADYVDSSTTYMHTERHDMNVILPALYQEADDKRSPYTLYRDTCIHYTSVDVDSAADSLIYRFPHLNTSEDYAVIVEFYTECDSTTQLQVTAGSTVDTVQIPANSFSWYEQNVAAKTDTLNLAIRRVSQFGFVPVSRVLVRRRSSSGFFMSAGGPQSAGPVQIPFCLYQPFPNPFSSAATIRYSLPYATHVSLKIYDVSGRLVNKLVDGEVAPGVHQLRWAGKDDVNRRCAAGVYFVRFQAADYQASKKMVLIK